MIYPKLGNHPDIKIFKKIFKENSCNMVSFELKGNRTSADKFAKNANRISFAPTLGDVGTTLSTHLLVHIVVYQNPKRKKMGITESFLEFQLD